MALKLRIAVSVFFGVMTFAICAIWALSYWRMDQLIRHVSATDFFALTTMQGQLTIGKSNDPNLSLEFPSEWTRRGFAMKDWDAALSGPVAYFPSTRNTHFFPWPTLNRKPFVVQPGVTYLEAAIPYWIVAVVLAAISCLAWYIPTVRLAALRWILPDFSLRTLLTATTLLALVLGFVVWLIR